MVQWSRIHLPKQEMRVQSLDQEDLLEEEMATPSNILTWKIPWTEEPGRLQFMRMQRDTTQRACNLNPAFIPKPLLPRNPSSLGSKRGA